MNFIRALIGRKSTVPANSGIADTSPKVEPLDVARAALNAISVKDDNDKTVVAVLSELRPSKKKDKSTPEPVAQGTGTDKKEIPDSVNIWDMGSDATDAVNSAPSLKTSSAKKASAPRRRPARTKTRMLGFEQQDDKVTALFEANNQPTTATSNAMSMCPTAWLVVVSGPGRGASFPLFSGMSQIGRGADQPVSLDFGDTAISRENHASIAYDPSDSAFYLGHGGKANLVRLNNKPLLSTEAIKDGDEILIGETTLRIRTFCGPDFNWEMSNPEGDDNVAIA